MKLTFDLPAGTVTIDDQTLDARLLLQLTPDQLPTTSSVAHLLSLLAHYARDPQALKATTDLTVVVEDATTGGRPADVRVVLGGASFPAGERQVVKVSLATRLRVEAEGYLAREYTIATIKPQTLVARLTPLDPPEFDPLLAAETLDDFERMVINRRCAPTPARLEAAKTAASVATVTARQAISRVKELEAILASRADPEPPATRAVTTLPVEGA